ncbi:3-phosphoshikimate 1-carboxyvinyltransferase [Olsenella profusa]|uniref:3-phosphoshikimate 1-carboxyvinyltransferase n=1 Tax=Olsenella profusa TaxID=138595 RepID=A0ABS2EZT5_9ACTN|nr:3-phosphoshikimate 1-carboxyvinyltransferase [Olsenella profusa]
MNVTVSPGSLTGEVSAPSSKSEAHRLLICAAFAPGTTDIDCTTTSDDIDATARCLEALGAHITRTRRGFRVVPVPGTSATDNIPAPATGALLDCGESGSTLRFLLPVVAALGCEASLTGHGRLPQRPLSPLYEELVAHGVGLTPQGQVPLRVSGRLRPGRFSLPGNVSSQYVSGLLLAAPLMGAPTEVVVSEPVESLPYIGITVAALARFGVTVDEGRTEDSGAPARSYVVGGAERLSSPGTVSVGGDWSGAAFWLAAGALSEAGVSVRGLDVRSTQGDRQVLAALALLGARVLRGSEGAACAHDALAGRVIDVSNCPDLVPPLAAVAALAEGTTRITGAARLRLKESDRLETVSAAICALGGRARATDDGLVIEGVRELAGGTVDAAGDHRIAMMAAVLAARCTRPVTILGAECVAKSYPGFFEDLGRLGGTYRKES